MPEHDKPDLDRPFDDLQGHDPAAEEDRLEQVESAKARAESHDKPKHSGGDHH